MINRKNKSLRALVQHLMAEEDRLNKDEGAWLKSLGEIGDLSRIILEMKEEISSLKRRLKRHEQETRRQR